MMHPNGALSSQNKQPPNSKGLHALNCSHLLMDTEYYLLRVRAPTYIIILWEYHLSQSPWDLMNYYFPESRTTHNLEEPSCNRQTPLSRSRKCVRGWHLPGSQSRTEKLWRNSRSFTLELAMVTSSKSHLGLQFNNWSKQKDTPSKHKETRYHPFWGFSYFSKTYFFISANNSPFIIIYEWKTFADLFWFVWFLRPGSLLWPRLASWPCWESVAVPPYTIPSHF